MLQNIRDNAQSTMAKIIVGFIVVTFSIFGVDSIIGGLSGEPEVATVNGEEITEREFLREVELKRRQIINQMGDKVDPSLIDDDVLNKAVLDQLIEQKLVLQALEAMSFDISEPALVQQIRMTPQFHSDGQFDNEVFLSAIRNIGMTTNGFKDFLKKQIQIAQIRNGVALSSFVTDSEVSLLMDIDSEKRSIDLVTIGLENMSQPAISDEEIEAYYQSNRAKLTTDEMVEVSYVLVDKNKIAESITVSEEELVAAYEAEKNSFVRPEERQVAHILIELSDELNETAAVALATELGTKINAGGDFGDLAKEYSKDIGSAESGGDLGMAPRGTYAEEFELAVDKLAVGDVSGPVVTEFGVHLIKLIAKSEPKTPELMEVRDNLMAGLKVKKATDQYIELNQRLADLSYESPDLVEPSEVLGLTIEKGTVHRDQGEGVLGSAKVQKVAFSDDVLKEQLNSQPIELSQDQTIVLRATKYSPVREKTVVEAREDIIDALVVSKKKTLAEQSLMAVADKLKSGVTLADLDIEQAEHAMTVKTLDKLARSDNRASREVLENVFKLKRPEGNSSTYAIIEGKNDAEVSLVVLRSAAQDDGYNLNDEQKSMFKQAIAGQSGGGEYRALLDDLQDRAEIERL